MLIEAVEGTAWLLLLAICQCDSRRDASTNNFLFSLSSRRRETLNLALWSFGAKRAISSSVGAIGALGAEDSSGVVGVLGGAGASSFFLVRLSGETNGG